MTAMDDALDAAALVMLNTQQATRWAMPEAGGVEGAVLRELLPRRHAAEVIAAFLRALPDTTKVELPLYIMGADTGIRHSERFLDNQLGALADAVERAGDA